MQQAKQPSKEIDIQPFDFNLVGDNSFNLIQGKRGTGKTTFACYVAKNSRNKDTSVFYVIAGSAKVAARWSRIVHPSCIMEPSVAWLEQLIADCNVLVKKYGDHIPKCAYMELFIDDCGPLEWFMGSHALKWLACNGRQFPLKIWIILQYIITAPPVVRENFDFVCILATKNARCMKIIQGEYVTIPPREFTAVLLELTQRKGLMVIDNTNGSTELADYCFWARVQGPNIDDNEEEENDGKKQKKYLGSPAFLKWLEQHSLERFETECGHHEIGSEEGDDMVENLLNAVCPESSPYQDARGRIFVRQIKHKSE
jgi:hypothetical protein